MRINIKGNLYLDWLGIGGSESIKNKMLRIYITYFTTESLLEDQ